eukprot:scaffold40398_cov54-Phaeocystis_antarctica.AAC.1
MLPSIVRRVDRGHVLLCRTGGSVLPYTHLTPLRRSLQYSHLDDQAKQAVKDAGVAASASPSSTQPRSA